MDLNKLVLSFANWILVIVVSLILLFCWLVFLLCVCFPLFSISWIWPVCNLIIFNILYIFVIISYLRAIFTTSFVPNDYKQELLKDKNDSTTIVDDSLSFVSDSNLPKIRNCTKCNQNKPDRAHHCSRCNSCILKMDHHCPWINNCVGWNNYKYFMLFTTYTFLLCIIGIILTLPCVFITWDWSSISYTEILVIVSVIIGGIFALILIGFVFMHYRLVFANLTTIESMEKKFEWNSSPWNINAYYNWTEVFGKKPYLWFLPIKTLSHDGTHFQTNTKTIENV